MKSSISLSEALALARFLPARVSARFLSQGRGGEAEAGQFPVVADEDMADYVASLTTIGAPHLGSGFGDWGIEKGLDRAVGLLEGMVDLKGFEDLTSAACQQFNDFAREKEATNSVVYQTYASERKARQCSGFFKSRYTLFFKEKARTTGWCQSGLSDGIKSWLRKMEERRSSRSIPFRCRRTT